MVTTDSKLAQAFVGSEMRCAYLAEQRVLISKNATGDGYMVYGGEQQIAQSNPDAGLAWLRKHGHNVSEDSDWMPIEVHFAGKRADTLVEMIGESELPSACYRFLLAQACAGENVFAYSNEIGGIVRKYIWFMGQNYTVAEFSQGWQTGEIHP